MGNTPSCEVPELPRQPQKLSKTKNTKQLSGDSFFDYRHGSYPAAASTLRHRPSKNSDSWPFVSSTYEIDESALTTSNDVAPQHLLASSKSAAPIENTTSSDRIAHLHGHRYLMDPAKAYGTHSKRKVDTSSHRQEPVLRPQLYTPHRRRSSNQIPGVATRMHKHSAPAMRSTSMPSGIPHSRPKGHDQQSDNEAQSPFRPPPSLTDHAERASTPCEKSYKQLGGMSFGTLRITNGSPTPSFRDSLDQKPLNSTTAIAPSALSPLSRSVTAFEHNPPPPPQHSWNMSSLWDDLPSSSPSTTSYPTGKANNNPQARCYAPEFQPGEVLDVRTEPSARHQTVQLHHTTSTGAKPSHLSRSDSGFGSTTSDGISRQTRSPSDSGYSSNLSFRSEKGSSNIDAFHNKKPTETSRDPVAHVEISGETASSENADWKTDWLNSRLPRQNVFKLKTKASFRTRLRENNDQRKPAGYFEPVAMPVSNDYPRGESETSMTETRAPDYSDLSGVPTVPRDIEQSLLGHIDWLQSTSSEQLRPKKNRHNPQTIVSLDGHWSEEPSANTGRAHNSIGRSGAELPGHEPQPYSPRYSNEINSGSGTYGSQVPSHGQYHTQKKTNDPSSMTGAVPAPAFLRQQPPSHHLHPKSSNQVRTAASMPDIERQRSRHASPPISLRNRKSGPSLDNFEVKASLQKEDGEQLNELFFEPATERHELASRETPDFPFPLCEHHERLWRASKKYAREREPAFIDLKSRYSPSYRNKPISR